MVKRKSATAAAASAKKAATAANKAAQAAQPKPKPKPALKSALKGKDGPKVLTEETVVVKTVVPKKVKVPAPIPTGLTIAAGTYERILYGLETSLESASVAGTSLTPIFMYPAHTHCIKALACSENGAYMATGSFDEVIKIYDLRSRKELGSLQQHEGTITALAFHSKNLLSAAEDGKICIWRAKDWECLKTIKGHQGRINALAIHPSGKVALTVGADRRLRSWDLTRGIRAAASKLPHEGENVMWNGAGETYAVVFGQSVEIHDVKTAARTHTFSLPRRILASARWQVGEEEGICCGLDNGEVALFVWPKEGDAPEGRIARTFKAHDIRVKGVESYILPSSLGEGAILITAASDGRIRTWNLSALLASEEEPTPLDEYNAKSRITCVAVAPSFPPA